ncbi:MFS transporter [Amycolatopsis sp. YIM 10]|uniref:MFS transporter n=1 Tax=Amycolatopsis sp. YIM 10 TaxID=2653857 RepID=UPI00128FCCC6|nr:MFS transporter [Amycolatopsis sp. YIM 10]QFU86919.1 bicyclomycin/multidrug efflux system [Amycolatopsis sp. YIM 10]
MLKRAPSKDPLATRLWPLHVATALQGVSLWVPVEKLFLTEIGFDAAAVGLMAAAYAGVVPLVEVFSGILADRWSRRGVLVLASLALAVCALLGGLSHDVPSYIFATLSLGIYFAMYSGTMDAIVYDTVLAETGDSGRFEQRIGRVRLIEAVALVASSLAGGWLAGAFSTRLTYFLTVPFALLSIVAYLGFTEPRLHQTGERTGLREQLALTFRTLVRRGRLLPIVALAVLAALLTQVVFEFGPLWLVALALPAVLHGPYWAVLVSTLGLGGLLGGRLALGRPRVLAAVCAGMLAASLVLALPVGIVLVTAAQVVLSLLVVVVTIHVTRLLHDAIPSAVRSGVASGVGALSWTVFLLFALVIGVLMDRGGPQSAGWLITGTTALACLLLAVVARRD